VRYDIYISLGVKGLKERAKNDVASHTFLSFLWRQVMDLCAWKSIRRKVTNAFVYTRGKSVL
jgi:hypothetical protein